MGLDYRVRCCPDGLITDRRRTVSVLDCTIRDGGICNDWHFDRDLVRRTADALLAAGVDILEIGYQTAAGVHAPGEVGPWKYCREADLLDVVKPSQMKIATMVDMGKFRLEDLKPRADSVVDTLRVATYAKDARAAVALLEGAMDLGYDVHCNVMAVTACTPDEVDAFLDVLRGSRVPNVSVVDSFGALYPHQVRYLVRKYKNWLRADQKVGVHLHNNQQTAFANAIAAIDEGVDIVDASVTGMGRGAGNVPLELLLMYLDDEKHDVRPILEIAPDYIELRNSLKWGYQMPYAVTGWLNLHPRAGIDAIRDGNHGYGVLWDKLTAHRTRPRHHRARVEAAPRLAPEDPVRHHPAADHTGDRAEPGPGGVPHHK